MQNKVHRALSLGHFQQDLFSGPKASRILSTILDKYDSFQ